jgi:hypothetical protein
MRGRRRKSEEKDRIGKIIRKERRGNEREGKEKKEVVNSSACYIKTRNLRPIFFKYWWFSYF